MHRNHRTIIPFLIRANVAVEGREPESAEFSVWWDKFTTVLGGVEGPKTWQRMKAVCEALLDEGVARPAGD